MAELFIELFSEEIPANLQADARKKIKQMLEERLKKKVINFKLSQSFSTPKRLVLLLQQGTEKGHANQCSTANLRKSENFEM